MMKVNQMVMCVSELKLDMYDIHSHINDIAFLNKDGDELVGQFIYQQTCAGLLLNIGYILKSPAPIYPELCQRKYGNQFYLGYPKVVKQT